MERKSLNIGYSNFKNTVKNNYYYVDKTLFIEELINTEEHVILIQRPLHFGKTFNLNMLKTFFDITEIDNYELFTDLKIWQTNENITSKCAKYPVIYLSFKNITDNNWENIFEKLKFTIAELFSKHKCVLSNLENKEDEKIFSEILNMTASQVVYENSLAILSNLLNYYYDAEVLILIDEYDTPILANYNYCEPQTLIFVQNLINNAFKDNDIIYKGVITGTIKIVNENMFAQPNKVGVFSLLDNRFADKFGFTADEVLQILKDFNLENKYDELNKYYNGYKIGDQQNIYAPTSVLNFALSYNNDYKSNCLNDYSENIFRNLIYHNSKNENRAYLLQLINNQYITKRIEQNILLSDLPKSSNLLWSLLLFNGYLTIKEKRDADYYDIKIPNAELKDIFNDIILKWLNNHIAIREDILLQMTQAIVNNNTVDLETSVREITRNILKYCETTILSENIYHIYSLAIAAILGNKYTIKCNLIENQRYSIVMIPHDKTMTAIVIEMSQIFRMKREVIKNFTERLHLEMENALTRLIDNKYYDELLQTELDNTIKILILFADEKPYVVTNQFKN